VVRPVLGQIYDSYVDAGAPEIGVSVEPLTRDPANSRQNAATIRELYRLGFLDAPELSNDQSDRVRPTAKTDLRGLARRRR
jgi:hypothetical protein